MRLRPAIYTHLLLFLLATGSFLLDSVVHAEEASSGDKESVTFLGVTTSVVPAALRAQLELPKGTGLVVREVVNDSPADKAGLLPHDILLRLNEQVLINGSQLAVLVQSFEPGTEILLHMVRKGEKSALKVTLAARPERGRPFWQFWESQPSTQAKADDTEREDAGPDTGSSEAHESTNGDRGGFFDQVFEHNEERLSVNLEALQEDLDQMREKIEAMAEDIDTSAIRQSIRKHMPGIYEKVVIRIENQNLYYEDAQGSVTWTIRDEKRFLRMKDREGELMFEGEFPEDAPQELPPAVNQRLQDLQKEGVYDFGL